MSWLGSLTSWFRKTPKINKPEADCQYLKMKNMILRIMIMACLIFKPLALLHTVIVAILSSLLVVGLEMTLLQQRMLRTDTCQSMRHIHHHMGQHLPL